MISLQFRTAFVFIGFLASCASPTSPPLVLDATQDTFGSIADADDGGVSDASSGDAGVDEDGGSGASDVPDGESHGQDTKQDAEDTWCDGQPRDGCPCDPKADAKKICCISKGTSLTCEGDKRWGKAFDGCECASNPPPADCTLPFGVKKLGLCPTPKKTTP